MSQRFWRTASSGAASSSSNSNNNRATASSVENSSPAMQQFKSSGECVPYQAPITPQQVQLERIKNIAGHLQHPTDTRSASATIATSSNNEAEETTLVANGATDTDQTKGKTENKNNKCHDEDGDDEDDCPICLEALDRSSHHRSKIVVGLKICQHTFHQTCLQDSWKRQNTMKCPVCRKPAVERTFGKSPSGSLSVSVLHRSCPGFRRTFKTLQLEYEIPSGLQQPYHDHPGLVYHGTIRTAYLPYNKAGLELLQRLVYAFEHGFTFQVGTSLTTGLQNCVTWSSIHHKTSLLGGVHGFPDGSYLRNCHGSLDALHIPPAATPGSNWTPSFPFHVHYHAPTSMPFMDDAMIILSTIAPQKRSKVFKNSVSNNDHHDSPMPVSNHQFANQYCSKCHDAITDTEALRVSTCQHILHKSCWTPAWNCPICHASVVSPNQSSPSGTLQMAILPNKTCPGCDAQTKVMECRYEIPSNQIQQPYHPNPGLSIPSTTRITYLPFNKPGCDLYIRLRCAWKNGYIFKIGTSLTSGKSNVVVWNAAIPHKTSLQGGAFGFPDASYLTACHAAVDALKIPDSRTCWTQWEQEKDANANTR